MVTPEAEAALTRMIERFWTVNLRLADEGVFRLSHDEFRTRMQQWFPEVAFPTFRQTFFSLKARGLLAEPWSLHEAFAFPLAKLLHHLGRDHRRWERIWERLPGGGRLASREALERTLFGFVEGERDGPRIREIIVRYACGETYDEIGRSYRITRERVRQILQQFVDIHRDTLGQFLLQFCMIQGGQLVYPLVDCRAQEGTFRVWILLARKLGIPVQIHREEERSFAVLGVGPEAFHAFFKQEREWFPSGVDLPSIARELEQEEGLGFLSSRDLGFLAHRVYLRRIRHRGVRIFLALRALGGRAHYLDITQKHNEMFPEQATDSMRIHNFLGNRHQRERYGIENDPRRGVYRLRSLS